MFDEQPRQPIEAFQDIDAEVLYRLGRASIHEDIMTDDMPIVLTCHDSNAGGSIDSPVQCGIFKQTEEGSGKGKTEKPPKFSVSFPLFGMSQEVEMDRESAMSFACDLALAIFGPTKNLKIDLMVQPRPMTRQMQPVLIKYGLMDPSKARMIREQPREVYGGRRGAANAMSAGEAKEAGISINVEPA